MSVNIAINGFGRIGRAVFKVAFELDEEVNIVAVNDLGEAENLCYLLQRDSVYGRYGREVELAGNQIKIDDRKIEMLCEKDPEKLPWKKMGVDVVVESTGVFTEKEKAYGHVKAGAKKVVISAPVKSDDMPTVVRGVNEVDAEGQEVISMASCTTNCVAPVVAVLDEVYGVKKAIMTTAHAYTATQALVDSPSGKDVRRGRAAAINVVPSSTGAAIAATKTLPGLKDRFDGVALRVPVPVVSVADVVCVVDKEVTTEEINEAFVKAADGELKGILAVVKEPVVSTDFVGDPHSAVVDLGMTKVVDGDLLKVMAWYDNEWGYSNRLVEQVIHMGNKDSD
jgi:glyceraldehyde 3-phosphate dehydrogenase